MNRRGFLSALAAVVAAPAVLLKAPDRVFIFGEVPPPGRLYISGAQQLTGWRETVYVAGAYSGSFQINELLEAHRVIGARAFSGATLDGQLARAVRDTCDSMKRVFAPPRRRLFTPRWWRRA